MATRRNQQPSQNSHRRPQINSQISNGGYEIPLAQLRPAQRTSIIEPLDLSVIRKSTINYNGFEYQLMPVEIEKDAEIGLIVGQIEGQQWVFIDEILPHGMIDMHGTLKEGDYIIQVGVYSLVGIDVTTALVLIERAYDEGRKSVSFVAARQQKPDLSHTEKKPDLTHSEKKSSTKKKEPAYERNRQESTARSFVEYEKEEEEDFQEPEEPHHSKERYNENTTQF